MAHINHVRVEVELIPEVANRSTRLTEIEVLVIVVVEVGRHI